MHTRLGEQTHPEEARIDRGELAQLLATLARNPLPVMVHRAASRVSAGQLASRYGASCTTSRGGGLDSRAVYDTLPASALSIAKQ